MRIPRHLPIHHQRFDADHPCQFDLKEGDDKLAEINFNLVTAKVETGPIPGTSPTTSWFLVKWGRFAGEGMRQHKAGC